MALRISDNLYIEGSIFGLRLISAIDATVITLSKEEIQGLADEFQKILASPPEKG